jgi:hypothetical protein
MNKIPNLSPERQALLERRMKGASFLRGYLCPWLIRVLAVEIHENWIEAIRYLNTDYLEEHKRELLRVSAP